MKLHVLGTCSGTEPDPNRHQTSLMFSCPGQIYVFDAGENCAWQAHNLGLKLTDIRAIFISHPHMDHVGGLPQLLWTIRKLDWVHHGCMEGRHIDVWTPCKPSYKAALELLKYTEGGFDINFELEHHEVVQGEIFADENLTVEARHNLHLGEKGPSYSFRIRGAGKTVVFSGDVATIEDMGPWLDEPVDELLMETGHHRVQDICNFVKARPWIGHLTFIHHGRAILDHFDEQWQAARNILGENRVCISRDGQCIDFDRPLNGLTVPTEGY